MSWAGAILATAGAVASFIAAVGLLRLPDALSRLQPVPKASVVGLVLALAGVVMIAPSAAVAVKAALIAAFSALVTPISGHLIGRAAYRQARGGRDDQ